MTFMIVAYAMFWILAFVFIFSIFNRQRNLQRDLDLMEQLLKDHEQADR
jgi:CcmD family protein